MLLLGGITRLNKDSDAVYCFDCDEQSNYTVEVLDKIDKAGVIDSVGSLHLFIE